MVRRFSALVLAAAALCAAAGCSADPAPAPGEPEVATLASAPPRPSSPAPPAPQRPRERLDMSEQDFTAMMKPYEDCMAKYGLTSKGIGIRDQKIDEKKYEKADADCRPKHYPLPPWEYDPTNPDAKDFARDVVACLKRKGVKYVEVNPDGVGFAFGGKNNHAESISKGMDLAPECEREAAAKR